MSARSGGSPTRCSPASSDGRRGRIINVSSVHAFTSLLVRRDGPVDDAILRSTLPDLSVMEEGTRRLWTELSGQRVTRPKDPPVWAN